MLRYAKRKAVSQNSDWSVVYVETPSDQQAKKETREYLMRLRTLAEQMGAAIIHVNARTTLQGLKHVLEREEGLGRPVAELMMAQRSANWWMGLCGMTLTRRLSPHLPEYTRLSIIPLRDKEFQQHFLAYCEINLKEIGMSLLAVAIASLSIYFLHSFWPDFIGENGRNKPIIYMIACTFAAGRYGLLPGLVASFASFVLLSLIFIPPYFEVVLADEANSSNLAFFMLAAVIVSLLANKEHAMKRYLLQKIDRLQSLLRLHRVTFIEQSHDHIIGMLDAELSSILEHEIAFFLPSLMDPGRLEAKFKSPEYFSDADWKALDVCWNEGKTTGIGSPYDPGSDWRFEPMVTATGEIGVLGVHIDSKNIPDTAYGRLITDIASVVAHILERTELEQLAENSRIHAEKEKLRAMLLSSVSHDLKTPLASVIGSLSVYRNMAEHLPPEQRAILITTALEEAQRLDSFITNILDMTRIESGQVEIKQDWVRPEELLKEVRKRLRQRLLSHEVIVEGAESMYEVMLDSIMTTQVLQNILDNAVKYTPAGTQITVSWKTEERGFAFIIRDCGPGIPEEYLDKVFDKYARIRRLDSQVAGTGLGLAIVKAIMEAQGGGIKASNYPDGGAVFTVWLPKWRSIKINDNNIEKQLVA